MAYSFADLEGIWIAAGGSKLTAPVAAAIAMAESGGNPTAHNGNASTGDNSYGLWQINMLGSMGSNRLKQFNGFGVNSYSDLFDPVKNAKAAMIVSNGGTNFTPWTTYSSGAYQKYMQGNVPPNLNAAGAGSTGGNGGPVTTGVVTDVLGGFTNDVLVPVEHFFGNIANYVFMGGCVFFGGLLIIGGVLVLLRDSDTLAAGASVGRTLWDVTLIGQMLNRKAMP